MLNLFNYLFQKGKWSRDRTLGIGRAIESKIHQFCQCCLRANIIQCLWLILSVNQAVNSERFILMFSVSEIN